MASETPRDPATRFAVAVSPSVNRYLAEPLVLMCASALFNGLTPGECMEIMSSGRVRSFARDELLFLQGQPIRHLIFIQSGSVKQTQLGESGNEVLVRMSGPGEAVDVHGGPASCGHSCSARAKEQCSALVWDYARLQEMMIQYPQISHNISKILSGRLTELEERFREMSTEKAAKRLALVLLRLLKQVGRPSEGGIQVALNHEELGQMTGTTLFTISRVLSKWVELGFVIIRRDAIIVSDTKQLEAFGAQGE